MWVIAFTRCISFGAIVILLRWSAARCFFSMTSTRKYSDAYCNARIAVAVNLRLVLKSCAISHTNLEKGSFRMSNIVACVCLKYLIWCNARVPDLNDFAHWGLRVRCVVLCLASFHFFACAAKTCLAENNNKTHVLHFLPYYGQKIKKMYNFG